MELDTVFPEWYSVVDPGFTGERVAARVAAIAKVAESVTLKDTSDLVLLFYNQDVRDEFIQSVRTSIHAADDTYVSHDKAELAVVAAGVLFKLFTKSSVVAHSAALFVLCGEFGGLRGTSRIDAVVARAHDYLVEEGSRIREQALSIPNLGEVLKNTTKKLQAATKEKATGEPAADINTSLEIQTDTISALKTFGVSLSQVLELMEKRRLEESSVLYWLLGGRSLASEEPFEKIEKARLVFLAADDLAVQTVHIPGPASCRAILKSVLSRGKGTAHQVTTDSCVSKLTADDGARLLKRTKSFTPVFMPLSFALEKAQEVNWSNGWVSAFIAQTKLKADASRPIEEFSEQFYRELLLARMFRGE